MDDLIKAALIAGVPGVIASVLTFLNNISARRAVRHAIIAEQHAADAKVAALATQGTVEIIKKQTDGLTKALVKTTAEAEHAKGKLEGAAEVKADIQAANGPLLGPENQRQDSP